MILKENEVPKHKKKKKKKNSPKADHKHEYVSIGCDDFLKIGKWRSKEYDYWVMVTKKCTICGKEIKESETFSEQEKADFLLEIENNKDNII